MSPDAPIVSLSNVPPGSTATVVAVDGGRAMTQRMLMLGIRRGTQLYVLHGPGSRGAVVRVGGARIALGRGVTERIRVQLTQSVQPVASVQEVAA